MWSPRLLVKMKLVSVVNKLKTGNRSRETDTCHLREFRSGPGREVAAVWLARPAAPSAASRRDKRPTLAVSPPRGAEHRSRGVGRAGPVCGLRGGPVVPGLWPAVSTRSALWAGVRFPHVVRVPVTLD